MLLPKTLGSAEGLVDPSGREPGARPRSFCPRPARPARQQGVDVVWDDDKGIKTIAARSRSFDTLRDHGRQIRRRNTHRRAPRRAAGASRHRGFAETRHASTAGSPPLSRTTSRSFSTAEAIPCRANQSICSQYPSRSRTEASNRTCETSQRWRLPAETNAAGHER